MQRVAVTRRCTDSFLSKKGTHSRNTYAKKINTERPVAILQRVANQCRWSLKIMRQTPMIVCRSLDPSSMRDMKKKKHLACTPRTTSSGVEGKRGTKSASRSNMLFMLHVEKEVCWWNRLEIHDPLLSTHLVRQKLFTMQAHGRTHSIRGL